MKKSMILLMLQGGLFGHMVYLNRMSLNDIWTWIFMVANAVFVVSYANLKAKGE